MEGKNDFRIDHFWMSYCINSSMRFQFSYWWKIDKVTFTKYLCLGWILGGTTIRLVAGMDIPENWSSPSWNRSFIHLDLYLPWILVDKFSNY
jgi:hypothetical protein